jgi:hypothetical protein
MNSVTSVDVIFLSDSVRRQTVGMDQLLLHPTIIAVHTFGRNREEIYTSINEVFIHVE